MKEEQWVAFNGVNESPRWVQEAQERWQAKAQELRLGVGQYEEWLWEVKGKEQWVSPEWKEHLEEGVWQQTSEKGVRWQMRSGSGLLVHPWEVQWNWSHKAHGVTVNVKGQGNRMWVRLKAKEWAPPALVLEYELEKPIKVPLWGLLGWQKAVKNVVKKVGALNVWQQFGKECFNGWNLNKDALGIDQEVLNTWWKLSQDSHQLKEMVWQQWENIWGEHFEKEDETTREKGNQWLKRRVVLSKNQCWVFQGSEVLSHFEKGAFGTIQSYWEKGEPYLVAKRDTGVSGWVKPESWWSLGLLRPYSLLSIWTLGQWSGARAVVMGHQFRQWCSSHPAAHKGGVFKEIGTQLGLLATVLEDQNQGVWAKKEFEESDSQEQDPWWRGDKVRVGVVRWVCDRKGTAQQWSAFILRQESSSGLSTMLVEDPLRQWYLLLWHRVDASGKGGQEGMSLVHAEPLGWKQNIQERWRDWMGKKIESGSMNEQWKKEWLLQKSIKEVLEAVRGARQECKALLKKRSEWGKWFRSHEDYASLWGMKTLGFEYFKGDPIKFHRVGFLAEAIEAEETQEGSVCTLKGWRLIKKEGVWCQLEKGDQSKPLEHSDWLWVDWWDKSSNMSLQGRTNYRNKESDWEEKIQEKWAVLYERTLLGGGQERGAGRGGGERRSKRL